MNQTLISTENMHACGVIAGHYGKEKQKIQAVQELSELICVLTRRPDQQGESYRSELLDELADSMIMIEQMRRLHEISLPELNERITKKVGRQLSRISRAQWKADDDVFGLGNGDDND